MYGGRDSLPDAEAHILFLKEVQQQKKSHQTVLYDGAQWCQLARTCAYMY